MTSATQRRDLPVRERFSFGENWRSFLKTLTPAKIREAEDSLLVHLGPLTGKRFLDVGSGSGLFSLASRNLGASVVSFDFDPASAACTEHLRQSHHPDDSAWTVRQGSILDAGMLSTLGMFDVVYSWGVLHHTGAMWEALDNVASLVKPGGLLFISIYNDQGGKSLRWRSFKKTFIRSPEWLQAFLCFAHIAYWTLRIFFIRLVRRQNPFEAYWSMVQGRGMSLWHDTRDWLGGYPFEVAKPEEIFNFYASRNFRLKKLKTCGGGHGCNEYVFEKDAASVAGDAPCA